MVGIQPLAKSKLDHSLTHKEGALLRITSHGCSGSPKRAQKVDLMFAAGMPWFNATLEPIGTISTILTTDIFHTAEQKQ